MYPTTLNRKGGNDEHRSSGHMGGTGPRYLLVRDKEGRTILYGQKVGNVCCLVHVLTQKAVEVAQKKNISAIRPD